MGNIFKINQAAKILLADMMRLNISFNEAWKDYNNAWYGGKLLESDKDKVMNFISETIDDIK